jgi:UDP-glucose 4-epimerase
MRLVVVERPVRTINTNVRGTEVLLELANRQRKLVVVASTSEVFGKSTSRYSARNTIY